MAVAVASYPRALMAEVLVVAAPQAVSLVAREASQRGLEQVLAPAGIKLKTPHDDAVLKRRRRRSYD